MRVIIMLPMEDIIITNIPTITGIICVMATVIIRPSGLALVTAEVIMAAIRHMDGIMVAVIQSMAGIMVAIEAVIVRAFMAAAGGMGAGLEVAFTVVIDKTRNIFNV
jgi:hypothetical protein